MAFLKEKKFSFISKTPSLTDETFAVVKFRGFEAISKPYEFEIMLVSDNPEIDLSEILKKPAIFIIHRENGGEIHYNGFLSRFDQLHEYGGYVFYRALLVPKLWWLTLTHHNQVFLDDSVPGIIGKTLIDGGLATFDFEFKTQKEYAQIDYVCQYGETHFNFMSRWAESEGIYYYFQQNENGEKVVFTDTKISHTDLPQEKILYYSPPSGLDTLHRTETIKTFTCSQRRLPTKVFVKDYNYEKPSLGIEGVADVDPAGIGEIYLYGEHFLTPEEGNRLAAIRAEELFCRKEQFFGESTIPFMVTGYTFDLQDHYRGSFNRKYLIEEVTHEGSQTGYMVSGIKSALSDMEENVYYLNHFTAIPADVQYRPVRKAEKPRIPGMINAKVDAEGSGNFAELDEQGRYKIRLPFDINSDHKEGKASHFIRMMQPYAGNDYGVHFPLHKGIEVQLSFVNGDPDRPIISGAIPNPETVSPVTAANQTKSIFRDNYGNELIFDSTPGDEHIRLHCPHHKSTLELGRSVLSDCDDDWFEWKGGNTIETGAGNKLEAYAGNILEAKAGISLDAMFGISNEIHLVGKQEALIGYDAGVHWGPEFKYHKGPTIEKSDADRTSLADEDNIVSAKNICSLVGGAKDKPGSTSIINLGEDKISMSVGNNKNPDKTEKSIEQIRQNLIIYPTMLGIGAALFGALMGVSMESFGNSKKTRNFLSTYMGVCEGLTMMATIVIVMYYGSKLKEKIKAVSHFDDPEDKVDSLIQLTRDDGIKFEVRKREPVITNSAIEMKKSGEVDINSFPSETESQKIFLGIGAAEKTAKITMQDKQIKLECGNSKIRITPDSGDIIIENDGTASGIIQIFSKGKLTIDSKAEINLQAPEVNCCKGTFKANSLEAY